MADDSEIGGRLKQARKAAGFQTAKAAAESLGVPYPTYSQHENGTRGVVREADLYTRRFRVSLDWLMKGRGEGPGESADGVGVREIKVVAHVQAGNWAETWEWDEQDQYPVYVPDDAIWRHFRLYGAEARGPSMNKRYPEGTVVVFAAVEETKEEPIAGKRYVVERRRPSGEAEHTVKLLYVDPEGKFWLVPESDDPRFQAPISVEEGTGDEDVVAIIGRVCYAVTRE